MKTIIKLSIVFILLLSILIPAAASADDGGYFEENIPYMYIGPYVWSDRYGGSWQFPPEALSVLDLRSIPEMSQHGGKPGLGLFFCTKPIVDDKDYVLLGTSFANSLSVQNLGLIENTWDINLASYSINGTIWEMFVRHGDPTGELRWKPLQPEMDGTLVIYINGFSPVVFAEDPPRFMPRHPSLNVLRRVFSHWRFFDHWKHFPLRVFPGFRFRR